MNGSKVCGTGNGITHNRRAHNCTKRKNQLLHFSATILQQTIRFSNRIQSTVRSPSNVRVREAKWKEKPKQSIESSHSKQWMQWNVK